MTEVDARRRNGQTARAIEVLAAVMASANGIGALLVLVEVSGCELAAKWTDEILVAVFVLFPIVSIAWARDGVKLLSSEWWSALRRSLKRCWWVVVATAGIAGIWVWLAVLPTCR